VAGMVGNLAAPCSPSAFSTGHQTWGRNWGGLGWNAALAEWWWG